MAGQALRSCPTCASTRSRSTSAASPTSCRSTTRSGATRCRCSFGVTEVTIATCEPLDVAWVAGDRGAHPRRSGWCSSARSRSRATRPSSTRCRARCATPIKMGETAALANFEQLVELGKTSKQLDANDQRRHPGRRLAVAVRLRPARLRHPPRAAPRAERHPLPHRRRDAHRLPAAAWRDERDDRARQAARPHGRGRAAAARSTAASRPAIRPATRSRCGCRRCPPPSARRW